MPSAISTGCVQESLLAHALAYADRGWSIIPVIGKQSAGLWKPFQIEPADENTLRRLFARQGVTGLAVVLGTVSGGLAVRDFDLVDAYRTWASEHPDDAKRLPTVKTARGFHVYGRLDEELFVTFADGELRADSRHYVLLPPSIHPDGEIYTWVNPLPEVGGLPALPESLVVCGDVPNQTQDNPVNPRKPIACAHDLADSELEVIIARTLPTGPRQRNRRLFNLARILKGLLFEADTDELLPIVRNWHRQALPHIRTKEFSESWADFRIAWDAIKRPAGRSFRAATLAADADTDPPFAYRYDGHLRRLAALCWQLQIQWGERAFPLACRTAGDFLGIDKTKAWRLLRTLQLDGVLRQVKKGSKASGKASEWRFLKPKEDL